ncbi:hypothetical protein ABM133_08850 [Enterococcus cecorum]|uniref:hypothetical protein n=1 Tax=Enterococcus cecorum TaxID=44008 RepID=UPI0032C411E1
MATLAKMVTKTLDVGVSNTTIDLSATIKSFDVLDTKFIFGITSNQGLAINLSGATVKYIVEYYVEGKTYAIEGNCLVVDINTISFNLPDQLRGYNGKALIGIYATLTDGTKIDIKNIVVNIEPSLMDKGTDFKARYYFESFDNVLASVKDAGNKAISQINTVLPGVQSKVAEIDRQIRSLPPIPDLFVAYANSADGTVNFSRVKPSENLLSNGDFSKGFDNVEIINSSQSNGTIEFVNYNGKACIKLTNVDDWRVSKYLNLKIGNQNGKIRTLEFDVLIKNGSLLIDDGVGNYVISSTNSNFVRYKKEIPITYNRNYIAFYGNYTPVTCYLTNFALHDGDVDIQPYLPSRYDNYRDSFMKYIGYGVKNSTNPSDYRWQVNPEWQQAQTDYEKAVMVKNSIDNLINDGDFSKNGTGWVLGPQTQIVDGHLVKSLATSSSCIDIELNGLSKIYVAADIWSENSNNMVSLNIFDKGGYVNGRLVDYTRNTVVTSVSNIININDGCRLDLSMSGYGNYSAYLDNVKIYNLTSIFGTGNEPNLEEFERLLAINVNSPTIYRQSILKAELNSNPINSILTTLSAENPSTTLGGTWAQLGTETKFSNTIYYWKRTN